MKAKYDFMKQNPEYKHFATNLQGDIVAFDMFGKPSVVYQSSPEEKQIRLDKARNEAASKDSTAIKNLADAAESQAHGDYLKARTEHPERFMRPSATKAPADKMAKDPEWMRKAALARAKEKIPGGAEMWPYAKDDVKQNALNESMQELQKEGFHNYGGSPSAAPATNGIDNNNPFMHLVPLGSTEDDTDPLASTDYTE
jgi:hypothetical protein